MTVLPAHSTGDHRKSSLSNRTGTRVVLVAIDRHRMQTARTSRTERTGGAFMTPRTARSRRRRAPLRS